MLGIDKLKYDMAKPIIDMFSGYKKFGCDSYTKYIKTSSIYVYYYHNDKNLILSNCFRDDITIFLSVIYGCYHDNPLNYEELNFFVKVAFKEILGVKINKVY